jgi:uncharacterized lipoprotein YddW (UPF0748 family)
MKKREFLKSLGTLGVIALTPELLLVSCKDDGPLTEVPVEKLIGEENWVWMSLDKELSDDVLLAKFEKLRQSAIGGVLIGGDDQRSFDLARKAGLRAHLWKWTLNRGDQEIMDNHPEWYAINRLGESCHDNPPYVDYYRWLCPSREEVIDFLINEFAELASKDYIDGIHLDYIRYSDVILPKALWKKYDVVQDEELPEFDYCYCEMCREKFKAQHGRDPLDIEDPSSDGDWLQFRYDSVTNIVNRIAEEVHKHSKPISAAVFPTPQIARKLVRQQWENWQVDMFFPMIYNRFYERDIDFISECVNVAVRTIKNQKPLYAGLYLPDMKDTRTLTTAYQWSVDNGAKGVSLFGDVSDEHWDAFKEVVSEKEEKKRIKQEKSGN